MSNRRNDFRHTFPVDQRLPAVLESLTTGIRYTGEIVDLSTAGLRLRLTGEVGPRPQEPLIVRFTLPSASGPVSVCAAAVYLCIVELDHFCGVHFVPSGSRSNDEKRKGLIYQFLIAQQRQALREQRLATER